MSLHLLSYIMKLRYYIPHFTLAVIFVFSNCMPSLAQQLGYGFRAGANFPSYSFSDGSTTSSTVNFQLSAFVDVPLVGNYLWLQPGLSLQGKGAKGDWFLNPLEPNDPAFSESKQNTMWLDVPVSLTGKLYTANGGFAFAGVGPYLGFGLSGQNKIGDRVLEDGGPAFAFGKDKSLRGLDYGVNFTLGYQLPFGLHLYGSYGLGLANLAPSDAIDDAYTQKNRVLSVGLGYAIEP